MFLFLSSAYAPHLIMHTHESYHFPVSAGVRCWIHKNTHAQALLYTPRYSCACICQAGAKRWLKSEVAFRVPLATRPCIVLRACVRVSLFSYICAFAPGCVGAVVLLPCSVHGLPTHRLTHPPTHPSTACGCLVENKQKQKTSGRR